MMCYTSTQNIETEASSLLLTITNIAAKLQNTLIFPLIRLHTLLTLQIFARSHLVMNHIPKRLNPTLNSSYITLEQLYGLDILILGCQQRKRDAHIFGVCGNQHRWMGHYTTIIP